MDADQYQLWESIKAALIALNDPAFQTPRLKRLRASLVATMNEIDLLYMTQTRERAVGYDGAMLEALRVKLRQGHLLSISKDADLLLEGMPGIADFFWVPHKRVSDEALLDAADRVLTNAKRHEEVFIGGGWDKDFIAQARTAAKALKAKLNDGNTVVNRRSRATASIPAAIAKGRKIMRTIDTTVKAQLVDDAPARERWKRAMRVPKKPGRPKNNRRGRRVDPPSEDA